MTGADDDRIIGRDQCWSSVRTMADVEWKRTLRLIRNHPVEFWKYAKKAKSEKGFLRLLEEAGENTDSAKPHWTKSEVVCLRKGMKEFSAYWGKYSKILTEYGRKGGSGILHDSRTPRSIKAKLYRMLKSEDAVATTSIPQVGETVEVFWTENKEWFRGEIIENIGKGQNGKARIRYFWDNSEYTHDFTTTLWQLIPTLELMPDPEDEESDSSEIGFSEDYGSSASKTSGLVTRIATYKKESSYLQPSEERKRKATTDSHVNRTTTTTEPEIGARVEVHWYNLGARSGWWQLFLRGCLF